MNSIAISMGDPLGIGPEVVIKAFLTIKSQRQVRFLVCGERAVFAGLRNSKTFFNRDDVIFLDVGTAKNPNKKIKAGTEAFKSLAMATMLVKSGVAHSLVTAPICKEHMNLAGFKFPGHTEYLCHEFGVKKFAMMLFNERLKVVLATIHEPISRVPKLVSKPLIKEKLELTTLVLQKHFGITKPRVAVCGLNPHAGEAGLIGSEDLKIVTPAIKEFCAKTKNVLVMGPVSADTIFYRALNGEFDVVLALYHDQGLIPIKTTGFDTGVNMTLGLPFVRTSPDHGTAFDIAGKNRACPKSMIAAIEMAIGACGRGDPAPTKKT